MPYTYHGAQDVTVRLSNGETHVLKPGDTIPDNVTSMMIPTERFIIAEVGGPSQIIDTIWGDARVSRELARLLSDPDA